MSFTANLRGVASSPSVHKYVYQLKPKPQHHHIDFASLVATMATLQKRNNALNLNGFVNNSGTTNNHITTRGSDWVRVLTLKESDG